MSAYSRDEISSMTADEFVDYYPDTLWGVADMVAELGRGRYRGMEFKRREAGVWDVTCACGTRLVAFVGDHPNSACFNVVSS